VAFFRRVRVSSDSGPKRLVSRRSSTLASPSSLPFISTSYQRLHEFFRGGQQGRRFARSLCCASAALAPSRPPHFQGGGVAGLHQRSGRRRRVLAWRDYSESFCCHSLSRSAMASGLGRSAW
jgi:hypothetical protein